MAERQLLTEFQWIIVEIDSIADVDAAVFLRSR